MKATADLLAAVTAVLVERLNARVQEKESSAVMRVVAFALGLGALFADVPDEQVFLTRYATTLAWVVFLPRATLDPTVRFLLLCHELQHVVQFWRLGPVRLVRMYLTGEGRVLLETEAERARMEARHRFGLGLPTRDELAARARDQGAELIMWNGEAAWKIGSDPATDPRIEGALRDAIDAASQTGIAQGFTSFDHLLWHRLRWREALGPGSAVVVHSDQRYGALGPGEALASPGQLRARCERAATQAAALVGRGDVRPDLTDGGAGHRPYLQLHGVSAVATVGYALEQPGVCLWALPTRSDAAGVEALRVLVAAARAGLWGVRALQGALGVAADGAYGPKTHAAAVVWASR